MRFKIHKTVYTANYVNKVFSIFLVFSLFAFDSGAQSSETINCKCQYYSSYSIIKYRQKLDRISQVFNKKNDLVCFIGSRSFSTDNVLFFTKTKNIYKAYFYNLTKGTHKIFVGKNTNELANRILEDANELQGVTQIKPQYISHDFSFFISPNNGKNIYEVCYSQVLAVKNSTVGQLFTYYLKNFK